MKLIQVNGWVGRLNAPLAQLIKDEEPDFLCMQEAFKPDTLVFSAFKDQYGFTDEVLAAGNFTDNFFASSWGYELGGSVLDVGNIIMSKHPLSHRQSFYTHGEYHVRTTQNVIPNTRVWQACQATLPGGQELWLSNYQGYLTGANPNGDETTIKTLQSVQDALAKLPHPMIFCGDLNINVTSEAIKILDSLGLVSLTAQNGVRTTLSEAHRAPKQDRESVACDYIYISPDIKVTRFEVSERLVSDHKALILEFEV